MDARRRFAISLHLFFALGVGIWPGVPVLSSSLPLPPPATFESISGIDLRQHVEFLASDELGGRYAVGPSNGVVARYLASRLRNYGFRGGAADGSFFQRFDLVAQAFNPEDSFLELSHGGTPTRFHVGQQIGLATALGQADVTGELIIVPYDRSSSPQEGALDLEGKIAVVPMVGTERTLDQKNLQTVKQLRVVRDVIESIRKHGAVGGVLLFQQDPEGLMTVDPRTAPPATSQGRLMFPRDVKSKTTYPVISVSDPLIIQALLQDTSVRSSDVFSIAPPGQYRPLGKAGRLTVSMVSPRLITQNVIGILDGEDPHLKNEYVMFSAHMDHIYSNPPEIYNGADDDASGVAAILEIAQAFALGPRPLRSILVVFHTGEEEGLLGSKYFVDHPSVPLSSIVVDFNVDMIGRSRAPEDSNPANRELSDPNTVYVIGADKLSQELQRLSEQTNEDTVKLVFDYRYNNESHPFRLYYRSDHWNYAKNGIPVIFYFTGLHEDYHQPSDDIEKLDFEKMARITRLIFATGWRVGNQDRRLKLNTQAP